MKIPSANAATWRDSDSVASRSVANVFECWIPSPDRSLTS
jgi:hypothetical protein